MSLFAGICAMNYLAANYSVHSMLLLFLIAQINIKLVELVPIEPLSSGEYKPVGPTEYQVLVEANADYATRRRLQQPFQLCLPCKCCSSTTCATLPCCFGIDCQLPNKPFGVCAFVPKTCSCTSCAV
ncbi:hypothetical protein CFOL_v3_27234 [Cephalotus follicularis]|uniref:DUF7866 domain-containing protein n=1 Tax=Cephalotus follicularis TaxID=3775 RepID=A0A1Q3CU59_CEPFO|nr:hypothetical protein CFOL_v3_27234 [Cephalotus follicularis]